MVEALVHSLSSWLPGVRIVRACNWREAQVCLHDATQYYAFIICDLGLQGATFDQVLQALRLWRPDTPILAMSNLSDPSAQELCEHYQIQHVSEKVTAAQLQEVLMACLGPQLWALCAQAPEDTSDPLRVLTQRQLDILQEVARGSSNRDIAVTLGISTETVHSHLRAIFKRLKVKNRTQASKLILERSSSVSPDLAERWGFDSRNPIGWLVARRK